MTRWPERFMYRVACTRKEASCIIGNLLLELRPMCERCRSLADDELALSTEDGLVIIGRDIAAVEGCSVFSGETIKVQLTDYGFEFYGSPKEVQRVRNTRCAYGTVHSPKEG